MATIHTRKLRECKVLVLELTGCGVETSKDWEMDWLYSDDVYPPIRTHFDPRSILQRRIVLRLLGET